MQRVGSIVVLVAVGSELRAKLVSKDRGQALRVSVCLLILILSIVDLHQRQFIILSVQMARTKNVGGGPGDDDQRPPPRKPTDPKGKATKRIASKNRKYLDRETARAAAVVEAADRAERGGARSGLVIADQPVSPALRAAIEDVERHHGSPAGTAMFAG